MEVLQTSNLSLVHRQELDEQSRLHQTEVQNIRREYESKLWAMQRAHEDQKDVIIQQVKAQVQSEVVKVQSVNSASISLLQQTNASQLSQVRDEYQKIVNQQVDFIRILKQEVVGLQQSKVNETPLRNQIEHLTASLRQANSQLQISSKRTLDMEAQIHHLSELSQLSLKQQNELTLQAQAIKILTQERDVLYARLEIMNQDIAIRGQGAAMRGQSGVQRIESQLGPQLQ
ncbi:hypothetical protein SS50377_24070 [Spironucleus salmonicida]|uniref:Uncharacterized protein n=2 Tax=Spironucleus salmonicida TaxID=348837 RepID=V6LU52_9EUKA|nr:hypothetical protein SS50377_24068 [Spironucleus salmonicida]KAH0574124.1 hypothetical protein SS50377_24070 [Spironucleus salmonicida]|eukprot:EST48140.1 Hypothetical protein SS50377_11701 [Spironucleus salmonicida]